jgi:hypothetical protein
MLSERIVACRLECPDADAEPLELSSRLLKIPPTKDLGCLCGGGRGGVRRDRELRLVPAMSLLAVGQTKMTAELWANRPPCFLLAAAPQAVRVNQGP